jgi:dihydrofolate reductase
MRRVVVTNNVTLDGVMQRRGEPTRTAEAGSIAAAGWPNSTLLTGDAGDAVAELKAQPGNDLVILGSGELIASLRRRDLIDTFVLLVHPLVLGVGRRLFGDDAVPAVLRLADSVTTPSGVTIAHISAVERTTGIFDQEPGAARRQPL